MKILLVEDDLDLGRLLLQFLEMNNFIVKHTVNAGSALDLIKTEDFELVIIDIMLPDSTGFDLATKIKQLNSELPFLFLTAKNKKEDIIKGLKIGAEDYITKPFEPEELVLRIKIILRKKVQEDNRNNCIGNSSINCNEFKLYTPKAEYKLTSKECTLFSYIINNKNRMLKRETLLKTVWGENDYFLGRSMDVFISRLRKYLKDDPEVLIETFRGIGYIFRDNQTD